MSLLHKGEQSSHCSPLDLKINGHYDLWTCISFGENSQIYSIIIYPASLDTAASLSPDKAYFIFEAATITIVSDGGYRWGDLNNHLICISNELKL